MARLNIPHFCYDWDEDWIEPGDPEMESCNCAPSEVLSGPEEKNA